MKKRTTTIGVFTPEAVLKRKIRASCRKPGSQKSPDGAFLPPSSSKDSIRAPHFEQRKAGLKERRFVQRAFPELQRHFARGSEIDPEKAESALELMDADTRQSDLFRLASLSWSVPASAGFGRRLRYLAWNEAVKPNHRGIKMVVEIGALARTRWLVPRAVRRTEYKAGNWSNFACWFFLVSAPDSWLSSP